MTVSMHKTLAALKLPTQVPHLLGVAKAIVVAMTGNRSFPSPVPTLAAVTAAIADLEAAETATRSRTVGAAAARNGKRAELVALLVRLKAYVQEVADAGGQNAPALIESACMNVKRAAAPSKRPFAVKQGAVSGSVRVVVRSAARRASYQWGWSTDGGSTWLLAPPTLKAETGLSGLAPGSTCFFRYRPVTKTGEADWSQPVSMIVR